MHIEIYKPHYICYIFKVYYKICTAYGFDIIRQISHKKQLILQNLFDLFFIFDKIKVSFKKICENNKEKGVIMDYKKLNINVKPEKIIPFHKSVYYVPINSEVDIFTETQEIIFNLSIGKSVEICFDESMNSYLSNRILDFMCGVLYAYNGSIKKTSENSFIFSPFKVNPELENNKSVDL